MQEEECSGRFRTEAKNQDYAITVVQLTTVGDKAQIKRKNSMVGEKERIERFLYHEDEEAKQSVQQAYSSSFGSSHHSHFPTKAETKFYELNERVKVKAKSSNGNQGCSEKFYEKTSSRFDEGIREAKKKKQMSEVDKLFQKIPNNPHDSLPVKLFTGLSKIESVKVLNDADVEVKQENLFFDRSDYSSGNACAIDSIHSHLRYRHQHSLNFFERTDYYKQNFHKSSKAVSIQDNVIDHLLNDDQPRRISNPTIYDLVPGSEIFDNENIVFGAPEPLSDEEIMNFNDLLENYK